jgi:perosamine synthetase
MNAGNSKSIPFGRPMLDDRELSAISQVLDSGILVHGERTHAFEHAFAERVGVRHAISVSSCTSGLHLCLFAQGISSGARVAVPSMTHVATAHAVELVGATPVFVDVDPATGNIDPAGLQAIDGPLAAIMVVHYLGLPCDMDRISRIAASKGAKVIEDCALSLDATFDGRKAGTLGQAGCFSFYPIKHMTSIEGGMVTTDDDVLAASIRQRRAFGYDRTVAERAKPGIYDVTALGFNYRMSEVEAAVGLVQLGKLDEFQRRRARNFALLFGELSGLRDVTVLPARAGKSISSHYCLNVVMPRDGSIERDKVVADLKSRGIGTSVHYPEAVPLFSYYRQKYGFEEKMFANASWLARGTISLPVGPHLDEADVLRVAKSVREAVDAAR